MEKHEIFSYVIDRYCDPPVNVLEVGRIRNNALNYLRGDGWSTLQFARNEKVRVLYSIDNDPETLAVCSQYPELSSERIVFAGGLKGLYLPPIDLLYLDAENEAGAIVRHYEAMRESLAVKAVILIDDTFHPAKKGDLIIPLLEKEGYQIKRIFPMALATKRNEQ